MKFQVINDKGVPVMGTEYVSCIPDEQQLSSMAMARYKFKIDGKAVSIKKIKQVIQDTSNL